MHVAGRVIDPARHVDPVPAAVVVRIAVGLRRSVRIVEVAGAVDVHVRLIECPAPRPIHRGGAFGERGRRRRRRRERGRGHVDMGGAHLVGGRAKSLARQGQRRTDECGADGEPERSPNPRAAVASIPHGCLSVGP